jgi:RimJ/RimL family protein N-acetyltransferase
MKPIIETKRCYLRELTVADAQHFYDLNADAEVIKYTGDKAFGNVMEAKSFLENYNQYELNGYGRWAVIEKYNNEFIGWCGLKYSPNLNEVDLGFRFFKKYWNLGYATERAMELNVASVKVLEKTGMTFVGKFEFDLHDGVVYQIENPNS